MSGEAGDRSGVVRAIRMDEIGGRERYHLLTSLLVPRPIGWVSSRSAAGLKNLAPFSFFAALASSPVLIGISFGARRGTPKDTLQNIRETGAFCVNVVTEKHLHAMNVSAGEHPPEVDEFTVAGVIAAESDLVDAPYVQDCPAVFECRLFDEVVLGNSGSVLVIGEVVGMRIGPELSFIPGTYLVEPESLRPVARLGGDYYGLIGETPRLPRPSV
jgi:flavin reductase (DIM6/NTAB) family NADH-FMN oxidoreductase RutF